MARLLVLHAHPAPRHSRANAALAAEARGIDGITFTDLYARYPRFDIDVDAEQAALVAHDVIVLQYPLFWYSTPSIVKEWLDLVLEHGFAYGAGGTALAGKTLMLAITAAGPAEAYTAQGYQGHPIRTFLTPMEQTARLCDMRFAPPYVLFGALKAPGDGRLAAHARAWRRLLAAIRDDRLDPATLDVPGGVLTADTLPAVEEV